MEIAVIAQYTAEIFTAFIQGAIALIGGGVLFEAGKGYVKTGLGNEFKGKAEALPFFFGVLVFGRALQELDPMINEIVYSVPSTSRLGVMILGSMILFNYSVRYFKYTDPKSLAVYVLGGLLAAAPYLG